MADALPADLATAVAGALRGDRTRLRSVVADVQQRSSEKAWAAILQQPQRTATRLPVSTAQPMPRPGPPREVSLRLPNGRRMRARISPAVAYRRDVEAVARVSAANTRRAFTALGHHRGAIEELRRSQGELQEKVQTLQNQADQTVIGLVQALAGLRRRVRQVSAQTTVLTSAVLPAGAPRPTTIPTGPPNATGARPLRARLAPQHTQRLEQVRAARALAVREQIQNVTNVVHTVQGAAYGQKGRVFSRNNLMLAGNQLVWSSLEPLLRSTGIVSASGAPLVAGLAALGTLVSGGVLLGERQHERFITGVTTFDGPTTEIVESLRDKVAEGFWLTFRERDDIPVTVTALDPVMAFAFVIGAVRRGSLILTKLNNSVPGGAPPDLGPVGEFPEGRVSWTIDLGPDFG